MALFCRRKRFLCEKLSIFKDEVGCSIQHEISLIYNWLNSKVYQQNNNKIVTDTIQWTKFCEINGSTSKYISKFSVPYELFWSLCCCGCFCWCFRRICYHILYSGSRDIIGTEYELKPLKQPIFLSNFFFDRFE